VQRPYYVNRRPTFLSHEERRIRRGSAREKREVGHAWDQTALNLVGLYRVYAPNSNHSLRDLRVHPHLRWRVRVGR